MHTDSGMVAEAFEDAVKSGVGQLVRDHVMTLRGLILGGVLLTVGCLPVEADRPECFPDELCPGSGVCRDGRCVAPSARAVTVRLDACLGAASGPCRSTLEPRLGLGGDGARACLVVGDEPLTLRWTPEAGLVVPGEPAMAIVMMVPVGRPLDAGVFFLDAGASCDRGLLQAGGCESGRGCLFALRRTGWVVVGDEGPVVLDFGEGGCDARWGETPPAERCDGRDDDCDGRADESFPLGARCASGIGACERPGSWVCAPDGLDAWCDAVAGEPGVESADGRDEDCDGTVDEGQVGCSGDEARICGTDNGICAVGRQRCVMVDGQSVHGPCVDEAGELVVAPGERVERCDGVDEDCDGRIDEAIRLAGTELAVGDRCRVTVDCPVPGRVLCSGGEPGCVPDGPVAGERCDGVDNDCDGRVDEDFTDLGTACLGGVGACATAGVMVCAGAETVCDAVAGEGSVERCGDRVDDDCDGVVDEGYDALDTPCALGQGACRAEGRWTCDVNDPTGLICDAVPGVAEVERCSGVDDDCDGVVDEGFDIASNPEHCGGCDRPCVGPNAVFGCAGGGCVIAACDEGYLDVDGEASTGCECNPLQLDRPDPEGDDAGAAADPDCDGIDGELDAAVFVSARSGDDIADGRSTTPVQSLARAVELAQGRSEPVYLDVGRYELGGATLTIPAGVDLHGGYRFDPDARSWAPRRVARVEAATVIAGSARPLVYADLDRPTLLDRVEVEAARGEAGRSAVAVTARRVGDHLRLRDVLLRGTEGGPGRAGQAGEHGLDGAAAGQDGATGSDATCPGCGGVGGVGACPADGGMGGRGGGQRDGDPAPRAATDGQDGIGVAGGLGGGRGVLPSAPGTAGEEGGVGADGANGDPGPAQGRLEDPATLLWAPRPSPTAGRGAPGSGGGGGGGGMAAAGRMLYSGGGGGGGAGGCPGEGGVGALGGGGSFGLLVAGGLVRLAGVRIEPGRGGIGGIGGAGGAGAPGQMGGRGVRHPLCPECGRGADGGRGGDGGCGGHAAGAAGGPAFAVLRVGRSDAIADAVPPLAESGIVFTNPYGAPLDAVATTAARSALIAGVPGQGGSGGERRGCGPAGDPGPDGAAGAIGCCAVVGIALQCAPLGACE